MGVTTYSVHVFVCRCDKCGKERQVKEDYDTAYNAAQAVRSLGWSYGKDKSVYCEQCRKLNRQDNYNRRYK